MTGFTPFLLNASPTSTQKFTGKASILGPNWTHLPTLTIGLLGVQIFWSVEMGYASPYLLSLGLSKSSMSLVFLAGPLSGLLMQPLIGILADTSTSRFGRRRPFMLIGTLVCVSAMLLLGYTRPFAALFTSPRYSPSNDTLTIVLAVLSIYLIDFSINAIMAMDRALLVDTLPPASQADGNAWAARMLGIGAVVGFFVGTIHLPEIFPFLGTTQLQVLSVIVSVLLFAGHATTAVCVRERVLLKNTTNVVGKDKRPNVVIREIRELWSNLITLPPVIRQICIIQFFAWIAWFPILFYTTLYIGDLYRRSTPLPLPPSSLSLPSSTSTTTTTATATDRDAEATRLGTRALFFSALLSLALNLLLPFFVATPASRAHTSRSAHIHTRGRGRFRLPRDRDRDRDRDRGGVIEDQEQGRGRRGLKIPERMKVNLGSLWAVSHLVLGGCMLGTLLTDSVAGATVLITITGFSWAITQWAPFSLLAEAILTTPDPSFSSSSGARNSILLADARTPVRTGVGVGVGDDDPEAEVFLGSEHDRHHEGHEDHEDHDDQDQDHRNHAPDHAPPSPSPSSSEDEDEDDTLLDAHAHAHAHDHALEEAAAARTERSSMHVLGNHHARVSRVELHPHPHYGNRNDEGIDEEWGGEGGEDEGGRGEGNGGSKGAGGLSAKAGIILGIHNVFIVIPQFIVTGLSAVVFAIFDPDVHPHPHILPPPSSAPGPIPAPAPAAPSLSLSSPNGTALLAEAQRAATTAIMNLARDAHPQPQPREAAVEQRGGQSNSVVYIFRVGGVSALIAFVLCWRLARELRHR